MFRKLNELKQLTSEEITEMINLHYSTKETIRCDEVREKAIYKVEEQLYKDNLPQYKNFKKLITEDEEVTFLEF